jgi:hypothetical protein
MNRPVYSKNGHMLCGVDVHAIVRGCCPQSQAVVFIPGKYKDYGYVLRLCDAHERLCVIHDRLPFLSLQHDSSAVSWLTHLRVNILTPFSMFWFSDSRPI